MPRTMARLTRCLSQHVSHFSPVCAEMRRPNSIRSLEIAGPSTPVVSTARGSKRYLRASAAYRVRLRCSAARAADPGVTAQSVTWVVLKVLVQVASHTRDRPLLNGEIVMPSGRRPSPRSRPLGSRSAGTPAAARPRLIMSLIAACLGRRPGSRRHDS